MDKLHFLAGLPRSGSTLLGNILMQNPRFHCSATSNLIDLIVLTRNQFSEVMELKQNSTNESQLNVYRGILGGYYSHIERPVVFDKQRIWVRFIELLEQVHKSKVKILAPVRDIREILASFETLYRKNIPYRANKNEMANYAKHGTMEGRCDDLMVATGPVARPHNLLKDAFDRGLKDRIHLIGFNNLTTNPEKVMREVYEFLEEDYFDHDYENVQAVIHDDDEAHQIQGLHDIRRAVKPVKSKWKEVLGEKYEHLKSHNIWGVE